MKQQEKIDVDTRFLLANERTLLAWVRTSLALQAGGIALIHFSQSEHSQFGIAIILLGALTALIGYWRYRAADMAIRQAKLVDRGTGPLIITLVTVCIGIGAAVIF